MWVRDKRNGDGIYSQPKGKIIHCLWEDNQPIGPCIMKFNGHSY